MSKFKQKQCLLYKDVRLCWYTKKILLIHFLNHIKNCQKEAVNIIIVHENTVYENSGLWNVRSMKCLVYEMSGLWNVRSMRCPVYEMSGLWIVRLWNVRLWNVHLWNVPTPYFVYVYVFSKSNILLLFRSPNMRVTFSKI